MTEKETLTEVLRDLERRRRQGRRYTAARRPKPIGPVVADVLRLRGYARVQANKALAGAWSRAVAELVPLLNKEGDARLGTVRRGVVEVWVANSTLNQELTFAKRALLKRLQELVPDSKVRDIRFRVGKVR